MSAVYFSYAFYCCNVTTAVAIVNCMSLMYVGNPAVYMFTDGCRQVNEIMAFNEGHRSWFIGNSVQSGVSQDSQCSVFFLLIVFHHVTSLM